MSTERERMLAKRWGLVTLTIVALCVVRLFRTCVDELGELRAHTGLHQLAQRMSQLKPEAWKSPAIVVYGGLTCALLLGAALTVLALGLRDVIRGERDEA